jgi:hypothetical protein
MIRFAVALILFAVLSSPTRAQTFIRSLPTSTNVTSATKVPVDDATYGTRAITVNNLLVGVSTNPAVLAAITNVVTDVSTTLLGNKLDTTNGVPVVAGVSIGTNTLAKLEINGLFPLPANATNYWAAGDSWTAGEFVTPQTWTSSGSPYLMFSPLLYCNILSTNWGLNLTNRGVSGSRIARTGTAPNSTLAQLNVIPASWSGLVTVEHGYNDSTSENYGATQRTHTLFRQAADAVLARLFAADSANAQGLRADGTTIGGWSASGTVSDAGNAGTAPFPVGGVSTNTVQLRTLTGSQTVSFSGTNAFVVLENSSTGGIVEFRQGTNIIARANLGTPGETYFLPQALLAPNRSGTFTVTNVSGTNVLIGVGSVAAPTATVNRHVVLCTPGRLNGLRWNSVATSIAGAFTVAVQDWQPYKVFLADVASRVDPDTMVPSDDLNHPDPRGHIEIAKAISMSTRSPDDSQLNAPAARFLQGGLQVQGAQIYGGQYKGGPSVFLSMAADNKGYLDSFDYTTSTYYPLNIRARNVIVPNSGVTVSGGFSSVSQYPSGNFTSLAMSGGAGYLDSIYYDGFVTTSYLPLNLRAKSTRISGGGLTVSAGPTGTNDYPAGAFTQLAVAGSVGYLDSLNFTGSSAATFLPLEIRAKVTQFGTAGSGAVTIHSGFNSTNDYPNDDFLSLGFSGGEGYLDSLTNQAGVFSLLPLNLRGNRVQIGSGGQGGGLVVQGSFIDTNQYPAGAFTSLAMSGNEAYLDANTNSGTAVITVPLNIRSKGVIVSPGSQGMGLAVQGAYSAVTDYPTNKFLAFAISGGEAYVDAYDRTGGTSLAGLPINLRGTPVRIDNALELGNTSDTTLSRLSAGRLAVEGVQVALEPTTETLAYVTTNVTITAGKGPMQRSLLTVTNNFQLLWSGLTDNDGGVVHLIPATTNVTVLVSSPGRAAGSSAATATGSTTLTITGATNGWAELAWSVVSVGGTNRVSVNLGAY